MAKQKIKTATEGTLEVTRFINELEHPLKDAIELVRTLILESNPGILEQVKWNAPSFRHKYDFVTFNVRPADKIHLVFHHPFIASIKSPMLEGDYKDRRMVYFKNKAEIEKGRVELQQVIKQWIKLVEAENKPV